MTLNDAKDYLAMMEKLREKHEKHNKKAYQDARELSALVSIAENGNPIAKAIALKIISKF